MTAKAGTNFDFQAMTPDEITPRHTFDPDLARRLHRALTPGSEELHGVLQDPSQEVLRSALKNRHLGEEHLLALLKRRDLHEDSHLPVGTHLAILKNRRTPESWFTRFLPALRTPDLRNQLASKRLNPSQKKLVEEELKRRRG